MKYILKGKPIPLKRARFTSFPIPHVYDSQKLLKAESGLELRMQHGYSKLIDGPISLDVTFFMPIPTTYSKKKKASLMGQHHFKKPDLSNMIKYLEDVCIGIIFRDDSTIVTITAKKIYSDIPRTEFTITGEPHSEDQTPQDKKV